MMETFAWVPLAILVIDRMREDGITGPRVTGLGALFALMITAGFLPLIPACVVLLIGTSLVYGPRRIRTLQGAVTGMTLGLAMAGAILLPIIAVLRVYPPLEAHGSLPVGPLVTTLFPNALGHWQPSLMAFTGTSLTNSYYFSRSKCYHFRPPCTKQRSHGLPRCCSRVCFASGMFRNVGGGGRKKHTVNTDVRPPVAPGGCCLCRDDPPGAPPGAGTPTCAVIASASSVSALCDDCRSCPISDGHGHHLYLFANAPRRTLVGFLGVAVLIFVAYVFHRRQYGDKAVAVALGLAAIVAGAELASAVPSRYFVNASGAATNAGLNATGDGSEVLKVLRERLTTMSVLPRMWRSSRPRGRAFRLSGIWQM